MCHETRVAYIPRVYGSGCRRPVTLAASHCDVATSRPPGDGTNDTGGHHAAHQQGRGARPGSHGARPGRQAHDVHGNRQSAGRAVHARCLLRLHEVAAALTIEHVAADGARLLEPYAGRAVLNADAMFHGVVDDYLHRAHLSLGHPDAARWRHSAVSCYERLGARWWRDRLAGPPDGAARETTATVHFHQNDTGWTVGRDGATAVLPDVK